MISYEEFHTKLYRIFSHDPEINSIPLEMILEKIPTVNQLENIKEGTPVLIRLDLDVPLKNNEITDPSRIDTSLETLKYCIEQGWKVIMFGHIGREKENTLKPVCEAFKKILGKEIEFIHDWLNESTIKLEDAFISKLEDPKSPSIFMLENTRKYDVARIFWKASKENFDEICKKLYALATDFRKRVSEIVINEAIAASNFDFSSSVLPLVMSKTAMGFFISDEMNKHILNVKKANIIVFSGLKINKLDDLESLLDASDLRMIISAGSLAMALKKAKARLDGGDFCIGRGQVDEKEKFFIPESRIDQGKRIIQKCMDKNIELILPIDFVLDNGEISKSIPEDRVQFDIGPETRELVKNKVMEFVQASKNSSEHYTLFYNGVFGKCEDPRFEQGTKEFISLLAKMTKEGIATYVGGGEGRLALLKYGSLSDVTHAFTAGGTILKSLAGTHIKYLKAMYLQNL